MTNFVSAVSFNIWKLPCYMNHEHMKYFPCTYYEHFSSLQITLRELRHHSVMIRGMKYAYYHEFIE